MDQLIQELRDYIHDLETVIEEQLTIPPSEMRRYFEVSDSLIYGDQ